MTSLSFGFRLLIDYGCYRRYFWVLQLGTFFALETRTAAWEWSRLVGLFLVQFALGIGERERTAIFDQFEETRRLVFGYDASRTAAEGSQIPALSWLEGGALGAGEAHPGEI